MWPNLTLSWLSLVYVTGVSWAMVPVVWGLLGREAFGLIGFFAVIQNLFLLADLGLPALVGRMAALHASGMWGRDAYVCSCRRLEYLTWGLTGLLLLILWSLSEWIAGTWLQSSQWDPGTIQASIMAIAACAALRTLGALDIAALHGLGQARWLVVSNTVWVSFKQVGVWGSLLAWGATPGVYWAHMVVVHLAEWASLRLGHLKVARAGIADPMGNSAPPMRQQMSLALSMFGSSVVWILLFGMPMVLASGLLSLSEMGYLTVSLMVANGIRLLCESIHTELKPRLIVLHASGQTAKMWQLYGHATRLMTLVALGSVVLLAGIGEPFWQFMTGDSNGGPELSDWLWAYACGHALLALAGLPLDWLNAQGQLARALPVQAGLVCAWTLAMAWAMGQHGGLFAGRVWVGGAAVHLLALSTWVHAPLGLGKAGRWLCRDVLAVGLLVAGAGWWLKGGR
ncbi:MAG: hypothetical protein RIT26_206 [Pseudomonadota bacterium]|jgi:O-antigen/teichoic acid export membrane protein